MKKPTLNMVRGLAAAVRGIRRPGSVVRKKPTLSMARGLATAAHSDRNRKGSASPLCLSTVLVSWRNAYAGVPACNLDSTTLSQEDAVCLLLFTCERVVASRGARDVSLCVNAAESNLTRRVS